MKEISIIGLLTAENKPESETLKQIKAKGDAEKQPGKSVYIIGVKFSKGERQVVGFEAEAYCWLKCQMVG